MKAERLGAAAAGFALVAAAGCGSNEAPGTPQLGGLESIKVACMNVTGLPDFDENSCDAMTDEVRQSLEEFHRSVGGTVRVPEVKSEFVPGFRLSIKEAQDIRCLDISQPAHRQTVASMAKMITNTVVGDRKTAPGIGYHVVVNAPVDRCRTAPFKVDSEKEFCDTSPNQQGPTSIPQYAAAVMLGNQPPQVLHFAELAGNWSPLERSTVVHEWLHTGQSQEGQTGLGHEVALCPSNNPGSNVITDATSFEKGFTYPNPSIMSEYAPPSGSVDTTHLAVPHALQIGALDTSRVITPVESQTIDLSTVAGSGPAAIRVPLNVPGVRKAIQSYTEEMNLPSDAVDDYSLFIGSVPGAKQEESGSVRVYAAPDLGKQLGGLPTYLLGDLRRSNDSFTYLGANNNLKVVLNSLSSPLNPKAIVTLHID